jgi:hypothetical protein
LNNASQTVQACANEATMAGTGAIGYYLYNLKNFIAEQLVIKLKVKRKKCKSSNIFSLMRFSSKSSEPFVSVAAYRRRRCFERIFVKTSV